VLTYVIYEREGGGRSLLLQGGSLLANEAGQVVQCMQVVELVEML